MEVSTNGSTITVAHAAKSVTTNAATAKTISDSERTFTAITAITDSNGHIATITPTTFTLPDDNNTTYTLSTGSKGTNKGAIQLTATGGGTQEALINAGTLIGVSATSSGITINHAAPTMDTNLKGTDTTLGDSGSFNAVTSVTKDSYGHVTNYKVTKFTLPAAHTYSFKNTAVALSTVTNGYSVATTLTGSLGDNSTATFSVTSSSLKVSNPSGTTLAVELEWGSF